MTNLFENTVKLRGFLGRDAEAPEVNIVTNSSFAALTLCIKSRVWKDATNEWGFQTDVHRIICTDAALCSFARELKRGDYVEIEGELRALAQDRTVVMVGRCYPANHATHVVHAIRIHKLERPLIVVDTGEDD